MPISQPGSPYDVTVAWGNGQDHVQVATVCEGVPTGAKRIVDTVNEWLTAAKMPTVDYDQMCEQLRLVPDFSGWYVGFTQRRCVNELIEVLQRARNGAFGKDA